MSTIDRNMPATQESYSKIFTMIGSTLHTTYNKEHPTYIQDQEAVGKFFRQATGEEISIIGGQLKEIVNMMSNLEALPNQQKALESYQTQLNKILPDIVCEQICLSKEEFIIQKNIFKTAGYAVMSINNQIRNDF